MGLRPLALFGLLLSGCSNHPNAQVSRADAGCDWAQWGQNWAHTGMSCAVAQTFARPLAVVTFDPFVGQEVAEAAGSSGVPELRVHYASPLVVGDDAYIAVKGGTYLSCSPPGSSTPKPCGMDAWDKQVWTVQHHSWVGSDLVFQRSYASDWKPAYWPASGGWEPVFQPAVHDQVVWVPGAAGTVIRLDRQLGNPRLVNPFAPVINPNRFVTGPLVIDADGTLLYNVNEVDPVQPRILDGHGYLVRVPPDGAPSSVAYQDIVAGAPKPNDLCPMTYEHAGINGPYPKSFPAPEGKCGSQRPGFNSGPAVGPDGTIFVVSRAHLAENDDSLVALHPDLTPKWTFRMREILSDGCGVLATCSDGAAIGVDPDTGLKASIRVFDEASSVPVALPDGAVLYGGLTTYNGGRGHLIKVGADGKLRATYDFGWDVTPAVWTHDGTYSILTKDNHYFAPDGGVGPHDLTQLSQDLKVEWKFTATETRSCASQADGGLNCIADHPAGFEWCVNAPAVGRDGTLYANSEDGRIYAIHQGGILREQRFLVESLNAAYTPIVVDAKGRVYSLNGGVMTVVGE